MPIGKTDLLTDAQLQYFLREDGDFIKLIKVIGMHFHIENMISQPLEKKNNRYLLRDAWNHNASTNLYSVFGVIKNKRILNAYNRLKALRNIIILEAEIYNKTSGLIDSLLRYLEVCSYEIPKNVGFVDEPTPLVAPSKERLKELPLQPLENIISYYNPEIDLPDQPDRIFFGPKSG